VFRRVLLALVFVLALAGCSTTTETTATPDTVIGKVAKPPTVKGNAAAGKQVFETAGCASCHTLQDAGATGTVGPNLDDAKPSTELVTDRVTNGKGVMPAFGGQLTPKQIADVAAYVSQAAGS
jgi:mono/diheme cytochrome c family protein